MNNYAQKLLARKAQFLHAERNQAASDALYIMLGVLNETEHFGWNRLAALGAATTDDIHQLYEDDPLYAFEKLNEAVQQMGLNPADFDWESSENLHAMKVGNAAHEAFVERKIDEVKGHRAEAQRNAVAVMTVRLHLMYGFGEVRLKRFANNMRIAMRTFYADPVQGKKDLIEKMTKIGFLCVDDKILAARDDQGNWVKHSKKNAEIYDERMHEIEDNKTKFGNGSKKYNYKAARVRYA